MNQLVVDTDILILHLRGSKPVRDMLKEVAKTSQFKSMIKITSLYHLITNCGVQ